MTKFLYTFISKEMEVFILLDYAVILFIYY